MPKLYDTFTGSTGTALAAHTGEIGATWTLPVTAEPTETQQIEGNRLRFDNGTGAASAHYLSSGAPSSADQYVSATIYVYTVITTHYHGLTLRTDSTGANCYLVQYDPTVPGWSLYKKVSGSFTQLGSSVSQTLTGGQSYALYFSVKGTQIDFTVNGVSKFSTTDGAVTANGKVGLRLGRLAGAAGSSSTGIHIDVIEGSAVPFLRSVGDSVTVGMNASPQATKRWPYLVELAHTWTDNTRSVSGTQIIDQCSDDRNTSNNQVYLSTLPEDAERWLWLSGFNDVRYNGTNVNALETYRRCLRAAVMWMCRDPIDVGQMNNVGWTKTGTWTPGVVNGLNTSYSSTNGDYITGSISGTAITVCYLSRFGYGDAGTALEVRIDGSLVDTIDTSFGTASGYTNGGSGAARYVPMARRYAGLTAGAHTVVLTHNSTGGKYVQPAYVCGNGGTQAGHVIISNPYKVTDWTLGSPYNNGSDAAVDAYTAVIAEIVNEAQADGYKLVKWAFADAHVIKGTDEDADGIHPNNDGHQHIANAFESQLATYFSRNRGGYGSRARSRTAL